MMKNNFPSSNIFNLGDFPDEEEELENRKKDKPKP